ncbi:hypothetical protein LZ32DRAFT_523591 [Colletotrichum eremochloae]|nr:hypothetical protein LZ32DRAFT_523591 [Colletotrichum eremochloae]
MLRNDADNGLFRGLPARRKSHMKVLMKVFSRWAITMVIIFSIYAVILVYSNKEVMDQKTKRLFNSLITGLSIALGLAVASSLNHMITELRWWILSRRYRSKRKVDLILQANNLKHTIMLAARSKRWSIHLAALAWFILTIGSQVGLAAIGLCYSTDPADKQALLVPGNVSIPNMDTIETSRIVKSKPKQLGAKQYTANSYGLLSLAYEVGKLEEAPSARAIYEAGSPLTFCSEDLCKYVFYETSQESMTDESVGPLTIATNRSINSTSTCTARPVTSGGNGTSPDITVALENNGRLDVHLPVKGGTDQTTFMTNTTSDCGPGCAVITAFEASDTSPWYYTCNVTVGQVVNATRPEHQVGSNLTALAAAAIALQGYAASSLANDTNFQFQIYPAESTFGTPMNGSTEGLQVLVSSFAIGVIAVAAENNDDYIVEGAMPLKGTKLNVSHWNYINLILLLTATLQLALGIAAALVANRVVIPDRSEIEVAQVLRTMANRDRTVVSDASEKGSAGEPKATSLWIYRNRLVSNDGLYDLYMEEQ